MKLLLINTCGADGVVAIAQDAEVLGVEQLPGRGSSEHLLPAVARLMGARGWRVGELTAVGVATGPGSFTGVRVGLSAAKGLCEAGGIGLIGMSRLALVAAEETAADSVVAVLDAGRGEYYCGVYAAGECRIEEMLSGEAVSALLERNVAVTCEPRVAEALGGRPRLVPEPGPTEMLAMVRGRIAAGAWSDVVSVDANYLRRTDAELLQKGR